MTIMYLFPLFSLNRRFWCHFRTCNTGGNVIFIHFHLFIFFPKKQLEAIGGKTLKQNNC